MRSHLRLVLQLTTYRTGSEQGRAVMAKGSKSFPIGRNATTGRLAKVSTAKANPTKYVVERMPKPGRGDTK